MAVQPRRVALRRARAWRSCCPAIALFGFGMPLDRRRAVHAAAAADARPAAGPHLLGRRVRSARRRRCRSRSARCSPRRRLPAADRGGAVVVGAAGLYLLTREASSRSTSSAAMDLSLFFAGTAGSVPTRAPRTAGAAAARRRRADPVRLRRGHPAAAAALGRAAGRRRDLHHPLPPRPLARAGRDAQDVRPARARAAADIYGPPGLRRAVRRPAPDHRAHRLSAAARRARAARRGRASHVRDRRRSRSSHRVEAYGYAFVEDDRPGPLRRRARPRALGVQPGPDFGRLQRGETVDGVRPEQVMGPRRGGAGGSCISGDTAPCQARRGRPPTTPTCSCTRRRSCEDERVRARETAHSTARQAAEIARDAGVRLLALTPSLDPLLPARDARRGAGGVRQHGRAARLRRDRGAVPRARRAAASSSAEPRATAAP